MEGARAGEMDGEVTQYQRDAALELRFHDRMTEVVVAFTLAAAGTGTRATYRLQILPRSFVLKLMQPLIRRAVAKRTDGDAEKLKQLLA